LALYKDIKVGKYAISELYVIIGLTAVSERLLDTFTGKLFNEVSIICVVTKPNL
jgi:hypothetical protein